jgi:hypothetical protein
MLPIPIDLHRNIIMVVPGIKIAGLNPAANAEVNGKRHIIESVFLANPRRIIR